MTSAAQIGTAASQVPQWTFADRIRKVRRDVLRIEQTVFADRLGVTRQAYAAWESGRNEPRGILAVAMRVESMSGVPAAWLLGLDGPTRGTPPGGSGAVDTDRVTHVQSAGDEAAVIPFRQRTHAAAAVPQVGRAHPGEIRASA